MMAGAHRRERHRDVDGRLGFGAAIAAADGEEGKVESEKRSGRKRTDRAYPAEPVATIAQGIPGRS